MLCLSGVPEPDLAVSFELLGLLSSGKKALYLMNGGSKPRLLLWLSPALSFLYTWDPPQRTLSTLPRTQASTTVNSGHFNFLADLNSPSPFPLVNNPLGFSPPPPLVDHPFLPKSEFCRISAGLSFGCCLACNPPARNQDLSRILPDDTSSRKIHTHPVGWCSLNGKKEEDEKRIE
ncbi:hypothetical protein CRENBAI_025619 [Crenichthys baileyi]|uniref:Uncharacterized protein n=1 Tax=Crenichthys baileyi TaxID=28760 RepID=A0AAV9RAK2_9TELE